MGIDLKNTLIAMLSGWLCLCMLPAQALENRLAQHPSPYLALHGSDPVAWQEWNADTVARARRENKLLFVSVGYYACHWCHVMQSESYRDKKIAAQLNRDFIPVKVDRELNTGLDDALQDFSARLLKIGGWPLNAFVTPEGYPVYVVLYAPPAEFSSALTRLAERWNKDAAVVRDLARKAAPPVPKTRPAALLSKGDVEKLEQAFIAQARAEMDELRGGFGQVSKFPMAPQLTWLLERQARKPDPELAAFLRLTLDQMAMRGMRDAVHGGFFRYTTDPGWETPHFEKMLYDNAQLALIYLRAAEVLRESRYRIIGLNTVDFMLQVLAAPGGGFYASTSAVDAQGREGGYYLWKKNELEQHLNKEELKVVRRIWKLDVPAPLEQGYLAAEWVSPTAAERPLLQSAMKKLRSARANLFLPKDVKINTGLNGLALSALSAAAQIDPSYKIAAGRLFGFINGQLAPSGRVIKAFSKGKHVPGAELEDYAYVAQSFQDYAGVSGDRAAREAGLRIAREAWAKFVADSGWLREQQPLLATLKPETILADGATASPSAVLLLMSLRSNDPVLTSRALEALQWQPEAMARDAFSYPSQLQAYRLFLITAAER